ncbi:MAG: S9 family peptidase [Chloroflexota bacterium]|nr:S9 family peptidase [Chloroflexota bacterium]
MEERKLMTAEDLYGFRFASDPQISPDGANVAYVLAHIDRESDEYRQAVYLVPADGSTPPRRYTYGPKRDNHPRWSPDGSQLLFVSDREGKPQVYVMPSDGGEARKVTDLSNGAGCPVWSPDGARVAFISRTGVDVDEDISDIVSYHYTEAYYKDDGEGIKRGHNHLFVQDLDGGDTMQLTEGPDDYRDPAWSPDGAYIAVLRQQSARRAFEWGTDIYLVPASGGEARRLTPGDGPSYAPSFSPDGSRLAYLGHRNPPETGGSTNTGVWTVSLEGGEPTLLTADWDRSASNDDVNSDARWGTNEHRPTWRPDNSGIYFLATDHGATNIYTVPANGGSVRAVTNGERVIDAFSTGGDRLAYIAADLLNPGDLYASAPDGSTEVRLTGVNEEFLRGFTLSEPHEVRIQSTEGTEVQGWVMKPTGYVEGERYPLIMEVHGGPHTAYGYAFFHEFQVLAARGYGVLFTNPRGSTGYGQEFAVCIVKQWGERDYADVMAAADWAASQPWVDSERLGMTGGSYGGFMTNWVTGHTDRFKAAVTRRCLSNWVSFYGTSDIGPRFSEWMVGGTPWTNPEGYARMSPMTYVQNIRTPLLVIHSEEDHRCAVEQSEQLFVALKRLGCETEFVRYPQESHSLSRVGKPARRIENLERISAWFERYVDSES